MKSSLHASRLPTSSHPLDQDRAIRGESDRRVGHRLTLTRNKISISESWGRITSASIDRHRRSFSATVDCAERLSMGRKDSSLPTPLGSNTKDSRDAAPSSNNYSRRHAYPGAWADFKAITEEGPPDEDAFSYPFGDGNGVDDTSNVQDDGRPREL